MRIHTLGDEKHVISHAFNWSRCWGNCDINYYSEEGCENYLLSYATNNISRLKGDKKYEYQMKKMNSISNGLYLNTFKKLSPNDFV